MNLNYKLQFIKPKETVLELFCDPSYYAHHQAALGSIDYEQLEHQDDGTHFHIKCRYRVKSEAPLPGFAKKVLGETSEVTHEERWDRATGHGKLTIHVAGMPGTMTCDLALADGPKGCTKTFDWEVKVKIPLVGGKIEGLIAEDIKRKSAPDEAAVNKLLADS